ncbi:hypothetical protein L1049_008605 [Liquidambar formosana]|uniref:Uncharacterized protein n=1 Tax=Liquidambar formosana TaxID=63359 RepID=A0AAP0S9X2_LIQFO
MVMGRPDGFVLPAKFAGEGEDEPEYMRESGEGQREKGKKLEQAPASPAAKILNNNMELAELVKQGSTAEDLGEGHAEAERIQGLGFSREPRSQEESSSLRSSLKDVLPEKGLPEKVKVTTPNLSSNNAEEESKGESKHKKRRLEEKKHEKHEKHGEAAFS